MTGPTRTHDARKSAKTAATTSVSTTPDSPAVPGPDDGLRLDSHPRAAAVSVAIVGRGLLILLAPVHEHLGRVDVHPLDDLAADWTALALVALWNLATYWFADGGDHAWPDLYGRPQSSPSPAPRSPTRSRPGGAIGIAMSYEMYSSWGFSRSRSSVSLLVAGVWNNFAKLAMPVLALALLAFSGGGGERWTDHRRRAWHRRTDRRRDGLRAAAAQPGLGTPDRLARRSRRLERSCVHFGRPPVHGWEPRHDEVPRPDHPPAARPLAPDHPR